MKKVILDNVSKNYKLYNSLTYGFKNFVLKFPKSLIDLKKNSFKVLENVSFSVSDGECVGILGRNGSGKSTILSLIAGVIKPDKGRIEIKGRVTPMLELGSGFHPELTGIENIYLNGVLLGLRRREIKEKIEDIIDFSELGDFIYQPIKHYSSGMLARLGFSISSILNPDILLIDEILAVGDYKFQEKCRKKMLELKKSGSTIILVSHSNSDIEFLCDRAILIHNGKVVIDGDVKSAIKEYLKILS
jgi:lipopolysaccharide transport system ATP-binding protein|uniref:Putative ABC transporter related protein n=1 Tax=uncultured Aquificaceae bacterium TaxID=374108 RepID=A0A146JCE4_9AQUI|nr:putative ABC transporter related protein [uncultured Aquificaceae bacterium]